MLANVDDKVSALAMGVLLTFDLPEDWKTQAGEGAGRHMKRERRGKKSQHDEVKKY